MKKRYLLIGTVAVLGMFVGTNALAEESTMFKTNASFNTNSDLKKEGYPNINMDINAMPPNPGREIVKPIIKKEIRDTRLEMREVKKDLVNTNVKGHTEIKDLRQQNMGEIKDMRMENKGEIKDMRVDNKAEMDKLRIELIAKVNSGEINKEQAYVIFNETATTQREQNKTEMKDTREENRSLMKEKKTEAKNEIKEKKAELKNEFHQKMQVRFNAMIERLNKLSDRIQSRIDKLALDGKDMTAAQASLDVAVISIAQAEASAHAVVIVEGKDQVTMDTNKAVVEAVKELLKKAQKELTVTMSLLK